MSARPLPAATDPALGSRAWRARCSRVLMSLGLVVGLSAQASPAEPASVPTLPGTVAQASPGATRLPVLPVPPEVRALTATIGLGRQRLALVISQPRPAGLSLPATTRDAQAVAAALQAGGFTVMRRDHVGVSELQRVLQEFRGRLQPRDAGFIYVAGAGARVDGQSWLLTRDLSDASRASPQVLRETALPLSALVEALQVSPSSLRLLVVDAAAPVPGLPAVHRGLAEPALPDGVMALLSAQPGAEIVPLLPPPVHATNDPRALAGSPFGTALVHALTTPGTTGPGVLREAQRLAYDGTAGLLQPWLSGRTDEQDTLGDPGLMALLPSVSRQVAVDAVRRAAGLGADQLIGQQKDRAEPAPETRPPSAPDGTVRAVVGGAGTVAGAAAVLGQAGGAITGQGAAAVDAVLAAGTPAGVLAAPPSAPRTPVDTRLPDQRDPVDGPVWPPGLPASAAAEAPPRAAAPTVGATVPPGRPLPATPSAAPVPTVLPPLNPHGYAVGDRFTYRRTDDRTGEALGLLTQVILQLTSDDEMQARENDGVQVLDGQGRTRHRSGPAGQSSFSPVEQFWWAKPEPGESRDVDFSETFEQAGTRGERHWTGQVEVGDPTLLDTPAGRFRVLPMEGNGWYVLTDAGGRPLGGVKWERTVWYSTELGHPVAIDIIERDGHRQWLRRERIELLQAQTSRTVPR